MEALTPCPGCLLNYNCVCEHLPSVSASFYIATLIHENEQHRVTNTGRWLLKAVQPSSQHVWQRTLPCPELSRLISDEQYQPLLVFPSEESQPLKAKAENASQQGRIPLFIILDGTWQEAKKMLRKSPWLRELTTVHLAPESESCYQLRRNQEAGNLCTLEVGAEIIRTLGQQHQAEQLRAFLRHYMQAFQADKSGHRLK
ncbi:DTW domain-containing protein [Vibrio sp. Isolate23]|uniref:tRNA-uridine aminocarboxypropyltransferase n=1 Tax=unclassified Vibrio TaxID=2614977 RepID=UPI001EFE945E|nr:MULTISPECIES: DTW domain-containing protein [unclassified Vibrio]MCG9680685.1 DTW domain-containing protein [Vibrio sp. Isolate24]MCG9685055.1 DTW domain-containing protein [Vibrio sp. Isolate23]